MKKQMLLAICLLLISNSVLASKKSTKVPGVFRQGMIGEVTTLDPSFAKNSVEFQILQNTQETLIAIDPTTGSIVNQAASEYFISSDGLKITFTLRDNLFYSNGDKILAKDYAYSFRRLLNSKNLSIHAKQLNFVEGASELMEGIFFHPEKVGIRAKVEKGKSVLEISLLRPHPEILYFFTSPIAIPLPEKSVEAHGNAYFTTEHMLSSGPFVAKEKSPSHFEFTKNRHYRGVQQIQLRQAHLFLFSSAKQAQDNFLKGRLDQYGNRYSPVLSNAMQNLKGTDVLVFQPDLRTFFIRFHSRRVPTSQFKIRQALSQAIDRDQLETMAASNGEIKTFSLTPIQQKIYDPPNAYYYDVEGAKNTLEQLGYCVDKKKTQGCLPLPRLTITYPKTLLAQKIAIALQGQWQKLGFENLDVQGLDPEKFISSVNQGGFTIAIDEMAVDTYRFFDMLEAFESTQLTSIGSQSNVLDEMLKKSKSEPNFSDMLLKYRQAESYLLREVMIVPLLQASTPYLKALHVKGYEPNLWDLHPWQNISVP